MPAPRPAMLLDEAPLFILPGLVRHFGNIEDAIIVQQVHYFVQLNEQKNRRQFFQDNHWWVAMPVHEWVDSFRGVIANSTLRRHFDDLKRDGILVVSRFASDSRDQTLWYRVAYEKMDTEPADINDAPERATDVPTESKGSLLSMGNCPLSVRLSKKEHVPRVPTPEAEEVAAYLHKRISASFPAVPAARESGVPLSRRMNRWGLEIDRIMRTDKRTKDEMLAVIKFAHDDLRPKQPKVNGRTPFAGWATVVLSPANLSNPSLWAQMGDKAEPTPDIHPFNVAEYEASLERETAAEQARKAKA